MILLQRTQLTSLLLLCLTISVFNSSCSSSEKKKELAKRQELTKQQKIDVIADAYIYGYPLVLSSVQRDISTAVQRPEGRKAPINRFAHNRNLPTPTTAEVPYANVNTLMSTAWLDVSDEPVVLRLPAANGRYYVLEMMNAWTDVFASLGPRTSGSRANNFVVTGPQWHGNLPFNTREIRSATNNVLMISQIQVYGSGAIPSEVNQARAFQNNMDLMPLSQYAKEFKAPMVASQPIEEVDTKTPAWRQVQNMDAKIFFSSLAEEMKKNPPTSFDLKMVENLRRVGLVPGENFVYANLPREQKQILEAGYRWGRQKLTALVRAPHGQVVNGWTSLVSTGTFGSDYAERAYVARTALGSSLIDDIYYQWADVDQNMEKLSGKNRYVLHFAPNQAPPAYGFWSLTVYGPKGNLVANRLHRYSLSDHERISYYRDGSFDIYIQASSPGRSLEDNWLPTPSGEFQVMARLYWPKKEAISGTWKMAPLQRVPEVRRLSRSD